MTREGKMVGWNHADRPLGKSRSPLLCVHRGADGQHPHVLGQGQRRWGFMERGKESNHGV